MLVEALRRHLELAREGKASRPSSSEWEDVQRYADELQLLRLTSAGASLRPAGDAFLGLRGRDAVRWLLALEVVSAVGDGDPWRISAARAKAFAEEDQRCSIEHRDPPDWPWNYPTGRFELNGLVEVVEERDHRRGLCWRYQVTPFGVELFRELDHPSGEALRSLARSMLADEAHVALHGRPPIVSEVARLGLHTEMFAHELGNALVPVQLKVKRLRRQFQAAPSAAEYVETLDAIADGIARAVRFIDETARTTRFETVQDRLFLVEPAVRVAIEAVNPEIRHPITLTTGEGIERVYVRGWRDHFVLAILNLLRNAVQAGGDGVRIFVACEPATHEHGRVVLVLVEDDGPGVPEDRRSSIFADGVSFRAGGTGHGLAQVRKVVEDEFNGSVHCEQSVRGGARFVVRLPIPLEGET